MNIPKRQQKQQKQTTKETADSLTTASASIALLVCVILGSFQTENNKVLSTHHLYQPRARSRYHSRSRFAAIIIILFAETNERTRVVCTGGAFKR